MEIDFFANNERVAQLEADLATAPASDQLPLRCSLAWQLRQRDSKRALSLADEAQSLLAGTNVPQALHQSMALRLMLVRAEVKWLFGELSTSLRLAETALQGFTAQTDKIGCADAHWLLAWIATDQGNMARVNVELEVMAVCSLDPVRRCVAQAALARFAVARNIADAKQSAGLHFVTGSVSLHAAAQCWVEDFLGYAAKLNSDYVESVRHLSSAYSLALASGQVRRAMIAAMNIGDCFNQLNEYHTALEWAHRSLNLARQSNWPSSIASALMITGETLRRLQRFDAASDMLNKALALLASHVASRSYALVLQYLGEVELDRRQYASALDKFRLLEQRALALAQGDLLSIALRGQAHALLQLGQPQPALQAAQAALVGAKSNVIYQIAALRVLADIYSEYPAPLPELSAASVPLHYLRQAQELAATIQNYSMPGDLLDAVAQAHARVGNHELAFTISRQASLAYKSVLSQQANNRALALQLNHAIDRAQFDIAHHQKIAQAEARRAEVLQQTNETMAYLSRIGQEITAQLAADKVCVILNQHLQQLLGVSFVAVALVDEEAQAMNTVFSLDEGKPMPLFSFPLKDSAAKITVCARERREVLADYDLTEAAQNWPFSTIPTLSRMFFPLCLADRVLGVVTVQSRQRHAFGAREQMILRSLCAYTAIALSNAAAHGELHAANQLLKETQQQLVVQEKMAGLGTLTAGVAHEINNPTNFVHVAAQNQRVDIVEFEQFVAGLIEADDEPALMQAFQQRFARLSDNVATMLNGTQRIKSIVKDLRAFTRLDQTEKERVRLSACLNSTLNLVRTSWLEKVEFISELNDDPEVECWPELLNQVFMNLLVNGCQAIEEKQQTDLQTSLQTGSQTEFQRGRLCLGLNLSTDEANLLISFTDSGVGINAASQARILEPFYTTKAVGVGTGLGLSIAFSIVQKHGGSLNVSSTLGQGSCFTISLPLLV